MADRVEVICPCCNTKLVVDAATSEILSEDRPKQDHSRSFDDAMTDLKGSSKRRAEAFDKAFDKTKRLDDLLDKKFQEAQKKASEDTSEKPYNPLDFD